MKKILKRAAIVLLVLVVAGFLAFLYLIPPFTLIPPEEFARSATAGAPPLENIADPKTRAVAARGKYLVTIGACLDCHMTPGPQGSDPEKFMAGGFKIISRAHGTLVSRNLTPDRETGIGTRTDEEIARVLRSGIMHTGRSTSHRAMPWPVYANWTDEDLHAVVTYLRQLRPVAHRVPDPVTDAPLGDPAAIEAALGGADYGVKP